jgi:hypothetical protein
VNAPNDRLLLWLVPLLAVSWISLALLNPDGRSGLAEVIGIGYFIGSMFGHTTVAAAWAAYGPGRKRWRIPLSLIWVAMLGVAIAISMSIHGNRGGDAALEIGSCFFAQWLALQLPLWGLRFVLQSKLQHISDEPEGINAVKWQFGIRQLLIVTTIVGVIFGIGRLTVGLLLKAIGGGEFMVFLFLAGCAVVFSLPLLIAALLRRWTAVGVLIVLVLIGIATLGEAPLLQAATGNRGRPNIYDLAAVNLFASAFVLVVALVVRLNGFALTRSQPATAS